MNSRKETLYKSTDQKNLSLQEQQERKEKSVTEIAKVGNPNKYLGNYKSMAMFLLKSEFAKIEKHRSFKGFDFSSFENMDSFVMSVFLDSDKVKINALGKNLSIDSTFALSEIKSFGIGHQNDIILQLSEHLFLLAESFGVQFQGDTEDLAEDLVEDFGGYSVLDFMIFFSRCKKSKYKNENQHINVRGINREFVYDWITQYDKEKEDVRLLIQNELKSKYGSLTAKPSETSLTAEKFKEINGNITMSTQEEKLRRRMLETKAQEIRDDKKSMKLLDLTENGELVFNGRLGYSLNLRIWNFFYFDIASVFHPEESNSSLFEITERYCKSFLDQNENVYKAVDCNEIGASDFNESQFKSLQNKFYSFFKMTNEFTGTGRFVSPFDYIKASIYIALEELPQDQIKKIVDEKFRFEVESKDEKGIKSKKYYKIPFDSFATDKKNMYIANISKQLASNLDKKYYDHLRKSNKLLSFSETKKQFKLNYARKVVVSLFGKEFDVAWELFKN